MQKKEEKKKTPAWVWVLLGVLILIILLLFFLRPWGWFISSIGSSGNNYVPEIPILNDTLTEQSIPAFEYPTFEQPTLSEPKEREYKTSDKLSEIVFTRDTHSSDGQQIIDVKQTIKVSGYIQEVPLIQVSLNSVINRAYIFKNGKIDWDIYGNELETEEDSNCDVTWTVNNKGSSSSDANGKLQSLSARSILAMSYSESGFDTFGPAIELFAKADIKMLEVMNIQIKKDHVICQGETESKAITQDYISKINLPLTINGNPDSKKDYIGSFITEYDSFETSGDAFLKEGIATVPLDVNYADVDNWKVDYKVYMP